MASKRSGSNQTTRQLAETFQTDRYGVDTIQLTDKIPDERFPQDVLTDFAPHPRFGNMALSKRRGTRQEPGYWTVTYTFEGFTSGQTPEPTYELVSSLTQEPIQTHPDFVSTIAGTPAAPLNGAIFVDPDTGWQSEADNAVFKEFGPEAGGLGFGGSKAGIDSYLVPGAEWRVTSFQSTQPSSLLSVGTISSPYGGAPSLSGRDWLAWSNTWTRRGATYQVSRTWKLSGRNGWDQDIYGTD